MPNNTLNAGTTAAALIAMIALPSLARAAGDSADDPVLELIEVTATRIPAAVESVPAMITIVDGNEARRAARATCARRSRWSPASTSPLAATVGRRARSRA